MTSFTGVDAHESRNPFGVQDVPDPDGTDVVDFASKVHLSGAADDGNAERWAIAASDVHQDAIDGQWSSRWNGGVDPTITGDTEKTWKQGKAKIAAVEDRVYILFDWDGGARRGLLDARRDGPSGLTGRYINLSNPEITRPWTGVIVDRERIDGYWTNGRLDFRR